MDSIQIIEKYYNKNSKIYKILVTHSTNVTNKALEIANKNLHLKPDLKFIKEAAMIHDIGIIKTNAKKLGCTGIKPYICHGILGREIIEKEGFLKHALVCERHTGVGITIEDIKSENLPLPLRDMVPQTIEEEIICLADKFYSKASRGLNEEKTIDEIRAEISKFGQKKVNKFNYLVEKYLN